ncbi:GNAT family N-acetyltransferase [Ruminococcaceae bacterium OttesenSCG-928-A16]|nr:GNAT family N-acetyltransferase [Ruminococcaceae bacterium OttesenSCG-928-A16]
MAQFIDSGQSDREIEIGMEHCYIVQEGDIIAGFVITNDDVLHLIMIDVPYQNKGCGAKLLAFIEQQMFNHYPTIKVQTFEENSSAIRFYEKNGWRIKSVEHINEMGVNMLHMEKGR